MKPRLLDLFCKAGGTTRGYQLAGFHVTGVDIEPQPNYCGDDFYQGDALEWLEMLYDDPSFIASFDAIHASPPCQAYSRLAAMHPEREYPDLIPPVRHKLSRLALPYVIENVEGAPLVDPVMLCGSMFGLGVARGHLRRHRLFEVNFPTSDPPPCNHWGPAVGVYGHGGHSGKRRMLYKQEASEAMGIDWMTRDQMTQAIPPAYTFWLGCQLRWSL